MCLSWPVINCEPQERANWQGANVAPQVERSADNLRVFGEASCSETLTSLNTEPLTEAGRQPLPRHAEEVAYQLNQPIPIADF